MKKFCILLIRFYQKYLSPLKRKPTCRFKPTCSAYAIDAYTYRGFFIGSLLTFTRICRCQPFCAGGYDPVPLKGLKNPNGTNGIDYYDINDDRRRGGFVFNYSLPLESDHMSEK